MAGGELKWNCRSVCNTAGFSVSSDGILLLIAGNKSQAGSSWFLRVCFSPWACSRIAVVRNGALQLWCLSCTKWIVGLPLIPAARGHLCCKSCLSVCMNRCKAVLCLSNEWSALSWGSRGWHIPLQDVCQNGLCFSPGACLVAQHSSGTSNTAAERQTPLFWRRGLLQVQNHK